MVSNALKDKYHFLKSDTMSLKPEMLEDFTNLILSDLDKRGHSFSEISYSNPEHEGTTLRLKLEVVESSKRYIDKIIVRGYDDFPRKFIPSFTWGSSKNFQIHQFKKSIATAKAVMQRRNIALTEQDEAILAAVFDLSASYRTNK